MPSAGEQTESQYSVFPCLSILFVCQQSRSEAQKMFTRLPIYGSEPDSGNAEGYFDTKYDTFYLKGAWTEFKFLVDLLITINTTRSLRRSVQRSLEKIFEIRSLAVDLNTFGLLPLQIWTKFPQLEVLKIVYYPWNDVKTTTFAKHPPKNIQVHFELSFSLPTHALHSPNVSGGFINSPLSLCCRQDRDTAVDSSEN